MTKSKITKDEQETIKRIIEPYDPRSLSSGIAPVTTKKTHDDNNNNRPRRSSAPAEND